MYSFDATNVPSIAAGIPKTWISSNRIPLQLDQDAPFLLRAIEVSPTLLSIGIVDPWNNPICDPGQGPGFDNNGLPPILVSYVWAQTDGAGLAILESTPWGLWLPAGAVLGVYFENDTNATIAAPVINLHGIKRYSKGGCR